MNENKAKVYVAKKKTFIRQVNKRKFQFAKKYVNIPSLSLLQKYETGMEKAMDDKFTTKTVKYGGGSIVVWV